MLASWAMDEEGHRNTHHLVRLTRQSSTGFILRATSLSCAAGTSLISVMFSLPRIAM